MLKLEISQKFVSYKIFIVLNKVLTDEPKHQRRLNYSLSNFQIGKAFNCLKYLKHTFKKRP